MTNVFLKKGKKGALFLSSRSQGVCLLPASPVPPSPPQSIWSYLPDHMALGTLSAIGTSFMTYKHRRGPDALQQWWLQKLPPALRLSLSILTKFASAFVAEVLVEVGVDVHLPWMRSHARSHLQEWPQSFGLDPGMLKLAVITDHTFRLVVRVCPADQQAGELPCRVIPICIPPVFVPSAGFIQRGFMFLPRPLIEMLNDLG